MKTSIRTIIFAAAAIFTAVSCQKVPTATGSQDSVKSGEPIQVNINASLGDLVASDETKATVTSVVRLTWETGDKVQAYCGSTKISGDDGLTVTPSENGLFASLTGTITPPNSGETITFVYSNGCTADGLSFDFSNQTKDNGIPFVAYATLEYDGSEIKNKMVGFKFATSVMKIAVANLGGGAITNATISGINNKLTLAPSVSGEPEITTGIALYGASADITTTNVEAPSVGTKAIITVGLVPDDNKVRGIAVNQTNNTYRGAFTSAEIESSTSYTTPVSLFQCGTIGTDDSAHDYVLIAGTKWSTQNLWICDMGGYKHWRNSSNALITVPGSNGNVHIGDFFQWAVYENFVNKSMVDKGILLYNRFNHIRTGDTNCDVNFKYIPLPGGEPEDRYQYSKYAIAPYYAPSGDDIYEGTYLEYVAERSKTLIPTDDAASILWGSAWRTPTCDEFESLLAATYWQYDSQDQGYYVYAPQPGDTGKVDDGTGSYGKQFALLFFPAPGYGFQRGIAYASSPEILGVYWSSTAAGDKDAYCLQIRYNTNDNSKTRHITTYRRVYGCSIRPVSD